MASPYKNYPWTNLRDEEVLKRRLCDLELTLEGSAIQLYADKLYLELERRGVQIRPKIYLGDEWFSPESMVAIAVPFYFAHPRLMALEKKMMLEIEGETPDYFMKLLRHEAGHCFDHAYKFSKRPSWRKLFGSPHKEYKPEMYRPHPYSRSYVRHLDNWYAQSHPDEDFAETFAVWLDPHSNWRIEYKKWPTALAKLEYVDRLAREVSKKKPGGVGGYLPFSAGRLKISLEKYYSKRRKESSSQYPAFYDDDLLRLFGGQKDFPKREFGAVAFMNRNRKPLLDTVAYWSGEKKHIIEALIKKLTLRCDALDLRLGRAESETLLELSAYLATLVTHHLFTGTFKRTV